MYSTSTFPAALGSNRYGLRSTYTSDYTAPSQRFSRALASTNRSHNVPINVSSRPFIRSVSATPANRVPARFRESALTPVAAPVRSFVNRIAERDGQLDHSSRSISRMRSPSIFNERTRDELIDSIVHTRTREHRAMPGFKNATSWEERRRQNIDCDKVYPGIFLANGETIKNVDYLKSVGVTHVLNTAEGHVQVNPSKYPLHNINYFGFHVDDHPSANISRFFTRTSDFIDEALNRGGTIVVNCMMGWSRSASVVAAYLVSKKGMSSSEALEQIRMHRPIRPNPGFLQQLADYENLKRKNLVWNGI